MISSSIDLTENLDFGGHRWWEGHLADTPIDDWDQDAMSFDKYEKMLEYEQFFGKRRHENGKYRIFRETENSYWRKIHTHCNRCGQEFRLPWQYHNGLCKECDEILIHEYDGKIPWKNKKQEVFSRDLTQDIFNFR